jgi:hypothetical protein
MSKKLQSRGTNLAHDPSSLGCIGYNRPGKGVGFDDWSAKLTEPHDRPRLYRIPCGSLKRDAS